MRDRLIATARWSALVEAKLGYPSLEAGEREIVELAVRAVDLVIDQAAGARLKARRDRLPAEGLQHGIDLADSVRGQERQFLRLERLERHVHPALGMAGIPLAPPPPPPLPPPPPY